MKRSTIIIIVLFVILLGLAIMLSKKPAERGNQHLDLTGIDSSSIQSLKITAPEDKKIELKKEENLWKLADGHLADPDALNRATEALLEIKTSDLISTSKARRENYGVDETKGLDLMLSLSSGDPIHLILGTSEKGGAYARRAGKDSIFKLKKNINYYFPTETKRWLKLKLVDFKIEDLKSAEIAPAGEKAYRIIPGDDESRWKIEDNSLLPEGFRFDEKGAKSLVQAALNCRAGEIIDEVPEETDTGLGENEDRISLSSDDTTIALHLGGEAGENLIWARIDGRDRFFKIPEYQAKQLRKKIVDLRDLRLMSFDREKMTDLRISGKKTDIHLVKKEDGSWGIDEKTSKPPEPPDFDSTMVDGFVHSLLNLKAARYLGDASGQSTGLKHPALRLELDLAGSPPIQLNIGKKLPGKDTPALYFAQGNADDAIYGLSEFDMNRLSRGWELFKKPTPPPGGGMGNIDPETLAKLPPEIRRQLLQQMQQRRPIPPQSR